MTERLHLLDSYVLVGVLSAPLGDLVETAQKMKDDLTTGERERGRLLERVLEGEARTLLAEAGVSTTPPESEATVIVATYDGWSANDLRVLAQRLVALAPIVALLGSRSDKAHLVFAQSDGLLHDIPGLLRAAVEHIGGRGGGRGNLAQGGGERVELLDEALARAATAVRSK